MHQKYPIKEKKSFSLKILIKIYTRLFGGNDIFCISYIRIFRKKYFFIL